MAKFSATHTAFATNTVDLNSMANAAIVVSTLAVDNTTNLDPWGAIQGAITFNVAPTPSDTNTLDIYVQPSWDGSNAQTLLTGNLPQGALFLTSLPVKSNITTAQTMASAPFPMPGPIPFHLIIVNNTGTALSATAGRLSVYSWQTQ